MCERIASRVAIQRNRCAYCRCTMHLSKGKRKATRATLEHVVPKSRGGTKSLLNTVAVCYRCNNTRGDKPLTDTQFRRVREILLSNIAYLLSMHKHPRLPKGVTLL